MARNWPESWKSSTVIEVGMMLSEVIDSSEVPVPLIETVTGPLAVTTDPSVFVYSAAIVDVPAVTAVTSPGEPGVLTVATVAVLEAPRHIRRAREVLGQPSRAGYSLGE